MLPSWSCLCFATLWGTVYGLVSVQVQPGHMKHDNDTSASGRRLKAPYVAGVRSLEVLQEQADVLQERLAMLRDHGGSVLKRQIFSNRAHLSAEREKNRNLERNNAHIAFQIAMLQKSIGALRQRGEELLKKNDRIVSSMTSLHSTFDIAGEALHEELVAFQEKLTKAPEVAVLSELAELDAAAERNERKKAMLAQASDDFKKLSLLSLQPRAQISTQGSSKNSIHSMLDSLFEEVEELSEEQREREASLRETFEAKMRGVMNRRERLREEQAQLNESLVEVTLVHKKVKEGVKALSLAHQKLEVESKVIGRVAERLGHNSEWIFQEDFADDDGNAGRSYHSEQLPDEEERINQKLQPHKQQQERQTRVDASTRG